MSAALSQPEPDHRHSQAEAAWIATCARHENHRGRDGRGVNRLGQIVLDSMDRAIASEAITPGQFVLMVRRGGLGLPSNASADDFADWHAGIDALEFEMTKPPRGNFYGAPGSPFVNAAEAFFWMLDCVDAAAEGARTGSLRAGRPCDPDDVVLAVDRLKLPPVHTRTLAAWGKKRTAPAAGSDGERLWNEAMSLLTVALQAKGIVRATPLTVFELMDLPLTYLWLTAGVPKEPALDFAGKVEAA